MSFSTIQIANELQISLAVLCAFFTRSSVVRPFENVNLNALECLRDAPGIWATTSAAAPSPFASPFSRRFTFRVALASLFFCEKTATNTNWPTSKTQSRFDVWGLHTKVSRTRQIIKVWLTWSHCLSKNASIQHTCRIFLVCYVDASRQRCNKCHEGFLAFSTRKGGIGISTGGSTWQLGRTALIWCDRALKCHRKLGDEISTI